MPTYTKSSQASTKETKKDLSHIASPLEQEAIRIVKEEVSNWGIASAFVTERISFNMRNLIRQLRKNYWGVFDTPDDPTTGREKIWIPLTESTVEAVVKNIDLDQKDINFRAKKKESIGLTQIIRAIVKNKLDQIFFGEYLDQLERQLAIDGTVVWKTYSYKDEKGKTCTEIRNVDLLNFYIDPTAECIAKSDIVERAVLTVDEFKSMPGLINKELIVGEANLNPLDGDQRATFATDKMPKFVEVFERWGKMPLYLITGKEDDRKEFINGKMLFSRTGNSWAVHQIEKTDENKPYQEAWYTRVAGRWYGKGIAEKVMWLQLWINTVVNIRINRSYVAQLGIFKIKKNAGISAPMVSKLASNGAIMVQNMDDVQQFVMQEASQSSYKDEDVIQTWTQRVTSTFEAVTGEKLPGSTTATATAISNQSSASQFVLIKEGIGMFMQRWMKKDYLPLTMKEISLNEIVMITGDLEDLKVLDERIVNEKIYAKIEEIRSAGGLVDPNEVELERQRLLAQLRADGSQRFVKLLHEIDYTDYDVEVYITNEEFDKAVMSNDLVQALNIAPEYRDQIMEALFDLMGLKFNAQAKTPLPQVAGGAGAPAPTANTLQGLVTGANTR